MPKIVISGISEEVVRTVPGCPPADPCRGRGAGVPRGVDFF